MTKMIKKNNISLVFSLLLLSHLVVWTFVPFLSNKNLPLDVIEALAWASNLDWGFEKHPPLSAFFLEIFYQFFGRQDWAYYLLSQLFVIFSFVVVFKLAKEFLKKDLHALLSVLLLEGIYFYNFTTPEFNVNICQIPFWTLTIYYCWQSFKNDKVHDWVLFGLFAALGVLSKYLFIYLLIGVAIFFIFNLKKIKKFNFKYFIPIIVFLLVLTMMPRPPCTWPSAQLTGHGFQMSKRRNRPKPSSTAITWWVSQFSSGTTGISAIHWPTNSSQTMPGWSCTPICLAASPQMATPATAAIATQIRYTGKGKLANAANQTTASAEPTVPGAFGLRPEPKP